MVKILALGDPHGKLPRNLDKIISKNKIELIICVGDWAFTPNKPWIKKSWKGIKGSYVTKTYRDTVNKACSYGLPVLTLRGNMLMTNNKPKADKILRKHKNLINKWTGKYSYKRQNFVFFDVLYEEHNLHKGVDKKKSLSYRGKNKNKRRAIKLNKLLKENLKSVLIAHNPPYGYVDKAYTGEHVGSKILLNAIKKYKPRLVLCGHIYEAKGKAKIGKTIVYNLGWHGDYVVFDLNKDKIKLVESNFLKK